MYVVIDSKKWQSNVKRRKSNFKLLIASMYLDIDSKKWRCNVKQRKSKFKLLIHPAKGYLLPSMYVVIVSKKWRSNIKRCKSNFKLLMHSCILQSDIFFPQCTWRSIPKNGEVTLNDVNRISNCSNTHTSYKVVSS